jgi:hypothetical protein
MTQKSESVGCLMLPEIVDEPERKTGEVGGKSGNTSETVGPHLVGEFVDTPPDGAPTQGTPRTSTLVEFNGADTTLYDRAVLIYEQLVRQGRSDLASELNRARANKVIAVRELGPQRAAAALTDQTIALYERLVQQEGRCDLANDLSTLYECKATTLRDLGELERARTYQDKRETLSGRPGARSDARNVWKEADEDRSIQACDASTLVQDGTTLPPSDEPFVIDEATNPFAIIRYLLLQANRGEPGLGILKGCEFVRKLGDGGMGAVALVQRLLDGGTSELLALKIMQPHAAANPRNVERFEREIELNRTLIHPHIVPLKHWGRWRDVYFFTSQFCLGGDLARFTQRHGGKLTVEQALPIIYQVLDALEYAHCAGVVHRDVKPGNICLTGPDVGHDAMLADFGLAKAFATAGLSGITGPEVVGGCLQFMPQQLLDDFRMATPEVDVWSAAATLYYLLTGQPPRDFSGEPPERWLWVVSTKAPVPIRQREPSVPPRLAEVIDQALDDREALHFRSAAALRQAMESTS